MESEEFYRKIQEKIERAEFSPDFLEWNPDSVWHRIETQKPETKRVFLWWRAAAASVALLCLLGFYYFSNNQKPNELVSQTLRGNTAKSTDFPQPKVSGFQSVEVARSKRSTVSEIQDKISNDELIVSSEKNEVIDENTQPEIHKHPLPATTLIAADSPFERVLDVIPPKIETNDSQPFVETPKAERTVVLEIPDSEEFLRPEKAPKKTFFARLFKQVEKFNTEGNVDWNELHVKPNKIWAYMKDSMKNEKREAK